MTRLEILGNLTKSIDVSTTTTGTPYARFTVASERGRSKDSWTDFFHATAFGAACANLSQIPEGAFVRVSGYLRTSEFSGRQTIDIIARSVELWSAEEAAA